MIALSAGVSADPSAAAPCSTARAASPTCADLTLREPVATLSPDRHSVEVTVTVENVGNRGSDPTEIGITAPGWSPLRAAVGALAAPTDEFGASSQPIRLTLPVPADETGKTVQFVLTVNPDDKAPERSAENNSTTVPLEIPAEPPPGTRGPDLTIVEGTAAFEQDGKAVELHVTLANVGTTTAKPTQLIITAAGWPDQTRQLRALRPTQRQPLTLSIPAPDGQQGVATVFTVLVDPDRRTLDSNRENNSRSVTAAALPRPPPPTERADLVVVAKSHSFSQDGGTLLLNSTVQNAGRVRSSATTVIASAAGWPEVSAPVRALAPSEGVSASLRLAVPDAQRGLTSTFTLRVNADARVPESNRNNDTATIVVAVPAPSKEAVGDASGGVGGWPWWTIGVILAVISAVAALVRLLLRRLRPGSAPYRTGRGRSSRSSRPRPPPSPEPRDESDDLWVGVPSAEPRAPPGGSAAEPPTLEMQPSFAAERTVNTGFASPDRPLTALGGRAALECDRNYLFWLDIGAALPESIERVPTQIPQTVPTDALLDVVVHGAGLTPTDGEDAGQLRLSPEGAVVERPATKVEGERRPSSQRLIPPKWLPAPRGRLFFNVRTPTQPSLAQLRCNIYHRHVLIQSRIIGAEVRAEAGEPGRLTSELDYSLAPSLSPGHLAAIPRHRLSILLNKTERGTHLLTFEGEEDFRNSAEIDELALQQAIEIARQSLRRVAWGTELEWQEGDEYAYETFDLARLERDLIRLALPGFRLYAALADSLSGGAEKADELERLMVRPGLVQIALKGTSRRLLPAALFYDYRGLHANLPLDRYSLCEQFKAALANDQPLEQCACFTGDCPSRGERTRICPSGFWGYRHPLGLPISAIGAPDVPPEIEIDGSPSFTLGVATDLVDQEAHATAIRALLDGNVGFADSFEELLAELKTGSAAVVYLYCHGGLDRGAWPYVRVGPEGEPVLTADILYSERIRWSAPRPLVFINGCRTVAVEPQKLVEFAGALVGSAHAAGVIGTEITVFEPMATVFGIECLKRFLRGARVGEAVRAARLALLAQGNPLGLVYVPFALAGLRLATPRQAIDPSST